MDLDVFVILRHFSVSGDSNFASIFFFLSPLTNENLSSFTYPYVQTFLLTCKTKEDPLKSIECV